MNNTKQLASKIKLLVLDVDGVMTDGSLYFDDNGTEYKAFNSKDGHGIRMLQEAGINIAIITGRQSELLLHRARNLKLDLDLVYQGQRDKRAAFVDLLNKTQLTPEQIAYVGDDVIDLPIMSQVGLAIAVSDAHPFVIKHSHGTTNAAGGKGAVREVCEHILNAQGKLEALLNTYLQP